MDNARTNTITIDQIQKASEILKEHNPMVGRMWVCGTPEVLKECRKHFGDSIDYIEQPNAKYAYLGE